MTEYYPALKATVSDGKHHAVIVDDSVTIYDSTDSVPILKCSSGLLEAISDYFEGQRMMRIRKSLDDKNLDDIFTRTIAARNLLVPNTNGASLAPSRVVKYKPKGKRRKR